MILYSFLPRCAIERVIRSDGRLVAAYARRVHGRCPTCGTTSSAVHSRYERRPSDLPTVKRYHYASHDELRHHLQLFVDAYNYGRQIKTLRGLTPYEFICQTWTKEPKRFRFDPSHHIPVPYI